MALHDFVDKDEKNALAECVTAALQHTQAAVVGDPRGRRSGRNPTLAALLLFLPAMSMQQKRYRNDDMCCRGSPTHAQTQDLWCVCLCCCAVCAVH